MVIDGAARRQPHSSPDTTVRNSPNNNALVGQEDVHMADDKNKTGSPDRNRINMSEDYEVRDWSESLGVSPERLQEAVDAVGSNADKVREYLKQ
jgi:hypothetical protein